MERIKQQNRPLNVPVLYYLCRNQQIDHPHFIEVAPVSPEGLYLRDVIEKINSVRGRGMASMYSWSCKRSYRNVFVWNDLSEDDLIVPANDNEYILKGSELIVENSSGRFSPARNIKSENSKQLADQSYVSSTHDPVDASTQTEQRIIGNVSVNTLESLMKAHDYGNVEKEQQDEENKAQRNAKIRASNMLLQLISCGSVSLQDHESSRTSSSRSRSLDSKSSSRRPSTSIPFGDLDLSSENPGFKGVKLEDKQYFSGSLVETKLVTKEEISQLKRSSSYSNNRTNNCDSTTLSSSKCIPRSIMGSLSKRSTSVRFCEDSNSCFNMSPCISTNDSKIITEACLANKPFKKMESFADNKENVIKIEESSLQELESSSATECRTLN